MRRLRAAGGLLVIVLLVSSCIRFEGNITIADDGSGTVDIISALDPAALGSAFEDFDLPEDQMGSTEDLCAGFTAETSPGELPEGAQIAPYNEDGFCGTRVQYALPASTDHSAALSGVLDETSRLYKEGDNWFFESGVNLDEATADTAGAPPELIDSIFADASFTITVDLPGRAVAGQTNATEVGADGRFTWEIDVLNPPDRLFAQTEPGSGGGSGGSGGSGGGGLLRTILIAVAVLALIGLVAFLVLKKKKSGAGVTSQDISAGYTPQPFPAAPPQAAPGSFTPSPGPAFVAPVRPDVDISKATVVLNPAEAQRLAQQHLAGATPGAAAAPQPVYDEALGAWVVHDPVRGRLRHDPASDTWNPV